MIFHPVSVLYGRRLSNTKIYHGAAHALFVPKYSTRRRPTHQNIKNTWTGRLPQTESHLLKLISFNIHDCDSRAINKKTILKRGGDTFKDTREPRAYTISPTTSTSFLLSQSNAKVSKVQKGPVNSITSSAWPNQTYSPIG